MTTASPYIVFPPTWNEERYEAVVWVGAQMTHYIMYHCRSHPVYGPALYHHGFYGVYQSHTPSILGQHMEEVRQMVGGGETGDGSKAQLNALLGMFFYEWSNTAIQYRECKRQYDTAHPSYRNTCDLFIREWEQYVATTEPLYREWEKWNRTPGTDGIIPLLTTIQQRLLPIYEESSSHGYVAPPLPINLEEWYRYLATLVPGMPRLADDYLQRAVTPLETASDEEEDEEEEEEKDIMKNSNVQPIHASGASVSSTIGNIIIDKNEDAEKAKKAKEAEEVKESTENDSKDDTSPTIDHLLADSSSSIEDDTYLTYLLLSKKPENQLRALVVFPRLAIHLREVKSSFLAKLYPRDNLVRMEEWSDIIQWIRRWSPRVVVYVDDEKDGMEIENQKPLAVADAEDAVPSKHNGHSMAAEGGRRTRKRKGHMSRMRTRGNTKTGAKTKGRAKTKGKATSFKASCKRSEAILKKTRTRR